MDGCLSELAEPTVFRRMKLNLKKDLFGLDLSHATTHPLMPILSATGPVHNGNQQSRTDADGSIFNVYGWAAESSVAMFQGVKGKGSRKPIAYRVGYVFPLADRFFLCGHCVSPYMDAPMKLMMGADYGEPVTELVKRQWPHTFSLIEAGIAFSGEQVALARIVTDREYYFVGRALVSRSATRLDFPEEPLEGIFEAAMKVIDDSLKFPTDMPGLMQILGGPDRLERRLSLGKDIAEGFKDILGFLK